MKKIIASIISVCLIMSYVSVSAEVKVSSWAKDTVNQAEKMGIVPKDMVSSGDYTVKISRIRFSELIYNVFSLTGKVLKTAEKAPFTDTDKEFVSALYKDGIIYGKDEDSFAPTDNLTREEASTIFGRAIEKYCLAEFKTDNEVFKDDKSIHDWAREFVYEMKSAGLIKGFEDNTFRPLENMTEEEAVAISVRAMEELKILIGGEPVKTPAPTEAPKATATPSKGGTGGSNGGAASRPSATVKPVAPTSAPSATQTPSTPSTENEPTEDEVLDYIEGTTDSDIPPMQTEGEDRPGSDLEVGENDQHPSQDELLKAEEEMWEGMPTPEELEELFGSEE